jgi:TonB family protein
MLYIIELPPCRALRPRISTETRVVLRHSTLFLLAVSLLAAGHAKVSAERAAGERLTIAILDFGDIISGKDAADALRSSFASLPDFKLLDRDLSRSAALGAGYKGSLNLTVAEARDLGSAIGCDFYILGDAQTIRRSPSTGPVYFEAYSSVFIVSTGTGRLIAWDRPFFKAGSPQDATRNLLDELRRRSSEYATRLLHTGESERNARATPPPPLPLLLENPVGDFSDGANQGIRPPQPYRRLRPEYPETAAEAEAEGTVDVQVDLDSEGEVDRVEISKWAGFGLDDAVIGTVRRLHFRPAMRDGVPLPVRILLRYNFRKPDPKTVAK